MSAASGSTAPAWEPDGNAAAPYGNIVFYDANGNEVTSGTDLSSPFAFAVAVTPADTGATKATLTFYNPIDGESPSFWTGTYEAGPTTFSPSTGLPTGTPVGIVADAPTYPVVAASTASITDWLASNTPDTSAGYANTIQVRMTDAGPLNHGNAPGTYWETDIAYNTTSSPITVDGTEVPADGWAQLFPLVSASTTTLVASPPSPQTPGTEVTLTATVQPSGAAGVVQFFDGATLLGSPVTVNAGTATTTTTPGVGNHSYTADFVPTLGDESSAGTATATIVAGSTSKTSSYSISNVTATKFSPSKLGQGASDVGVTLTGGGFVSGATLAAAGVSFSSVSVVNSTTITAKASVGSTARVGAATVTVTDSQGSGSCTDCLTIVGGPKVTRISPSPLSRGASGVGVTVSGSGFATGATVAAAGVSFSSVRVVSSTSITAKATVSSSAKIGTVTVTVTEPAASGSGRGSCAACLSIVAPQGYYLLGRNGSVRALGDVPTLPGFTTSTSDPAVGIATTPDGDGYFAVTADGVVHTAGDAVYRGEVAHVSDIVSIVATSNGAGYWVLGADGQVYPFGNAAYHGDLLHLPGGKQVHVTNIVGMVASVTGSGYLLIGSDGGVFALGAVHFYGSLPGIGVKVDDISGILPAPGETGYVLVGTDGGAFVFGHGAPYKGSLPGEGIKVSDIVGLCITPDGQGYWMAGSNGDVYSFGDAAKFGPPADLAAALPIAAIGGT